MTSPVSDDLIDHLDKAFPSRCPALDTPDREIWFRAGQRAVVEHLMHLRDLYKDTVGPQADPLPQGYVALKTTMPEAF